MAEISQLVEQLRPVLGDAGILTGAEVAGRSAGIWRDDCVQAPVIFRPADTSGVAAVLSACHERGQTVVTHGGLTGLSGGAIAGPDDVVLSTERMTRIELTDPVNRLLRAQAGVRLQAAQEAAGQAGLRLALDLGARGSCTLGGNAATNAGGHNVLRYGMAREQILGVEAVLADGTVVSSLNTMLKNNAGYDLRQWFVGSEGTLGVITRLVLRLRPQCVTRETALLACTGFDQVAALLGRLDAALSGTLTAFEVMWRDYYALTAGERPPLAADHAYFVLVEAQGNDPQGDGARFLHAVQAAADDGLLDDAVICKSAAERAGLWAIRENVELTLQRGPAVIFDVSLPLSSMAAYVAEVDGRLREAWGDRYNLWVFGHAGDGNLHLVATAGDGGPAAIDRTEACVYEPLVPVGGSVTAEHGVGCEKKRWLRLTRSATEIDVMRRMKAALDPRGILNPGRIFDCGAGG